MAVDDVIARLAHEGGEAVEVAQEVAAGEDLDVDAEVPSLLGEGALHEADHLDLDLGAKARQEGVDVCFRAAGVAAADQMKDLHGHPSEKKT